MPTTVTQLPSIPDGTAHRMKRVQTLGHSSFSTSKLSSTKHGLHVLPHARRRFYRTDLDAHATTVSYPGSVRIIFCGSAAVALRPSPTASYTYAPYYPAFRTTRAQWRFLWRETLGSASHWRQVAGPRGEQAQDPPSILTDGSPTPLRCARLSLSPYTVVLRSGLGGAVI